MKTNVAIVGAGPAGLMLSHLLHLAGISSLIIERCSRAYCEARIRAGLIEQWAVDLLVETGVGARLQREGMTHSGIHIAFSGMLHDIDFLDRQITVYGQQEIVKDLIAERLKNGSNILFEASSATFEGIDSNSPVVRCTHNGKNKTIECDFIAGCDGFHGISRKSIPAGILTTHEQEYPFAWLGILAKARPIADKLIYSHHPRGFALFSMRSPMLVRNYLQCTPNEDLNEWPDERIWDELEVRLGGTRNLERGPIVERIVAQMRSFVVEPMQYGRLFLAGDSAHITPPTGAKGMNLAFADARVLSQALSAFYRDGTKDLLKDYSQTCLARVWKAQRFSQWMTQLFHSPHMIAELEHLIHSEAAAKSFAENYVG